MQGCIMTLLSLLVLLLTNILRASLDALQQKHCRSCLGSCVLCTLQLTWPLVSRSCAWRTWTECGLCPPKMMQRCKQTNCKLRWLPCQRCASSLDSCLRPEKASWLRTPSCLVDPPELLSMICTHKHLGKLPQLFSNSKCHGSVAQEPWPVPIYFA